MISRPGPGEPGVMVLMRAGASTPHRCTIDSYEVDERQSAFYLVATY